MKLIKWINGNISYYNHIKGSQWFIDRCKQMRSDSSGELDPFNDKDAAKGLMAFYVDLPLIVFSCIAIVVYLVFGDVWFPVVSCLVNIPLIKDWLSGGFSGELHWSRKL